ncbi:MAG TPA: Mur ligase family protein [Candidatus Saccharimonadales bacterium]|nr:Mur ligase family protein [Candidatus Saccharimonadales bacterium]
MPKITNMAEANAALLPYVPLVARLTGKDTTLDRIRVLMNLCGNPQDKIKIVHIAGTSGKTSTAYFMAALLRAAGKQVGLTVSPHVDSVTERVQIDGKPVDEHTFCQGLGEFLDIVEQMPERPSYFELLYAFSFWMFERAGVNYAVIETGMGGLHDATNIAARADKVCIITDIGFDHMHILGNTLAAIAAQKAGIIHEHNQAFMYRQSDEVTNVVQQWADAHQASLVLTTEEAERHSYQADFQPHMPEYQQRNWLLAHRTYKFLCERDGLPKLNADQLHRTQQIQVPARMDKRTVQGKTIIMDGAHNAQKMTTFLASFQHEYPGIKPAVVLAMKDGKEPADIGPLLAPLASRVVLTTFDTSQDLPAKSIPPSVLADIFAKAGVKNLQTIPDQHEAYQAMLGGPEPVCIITGSFYLLSQLRERENLA